MNATVKRVLDAGPTIKTRLEAMSKEELIAGYVTAQAAMSILFESAPLNVVMLASLYPQVWKDLMDELSLLESASKADLDALKRAN